LRWGAAPSLEIRVHKDNKVSRTPRILAAVVCAAMLGGCAQDFDLDQEFKPYYPPNSADSVAPKRVAKAKPKAQPADRALLEAPSEPDCGASKRPTRPGTAAATAELATQSLNDSAEPNADLAMRIKLEYERECYRQAEQRMRDRVKRLQASVRGSKTSDPGERRAQ
jgi:hypothetical protein